MTRSANKHVAEADGGGDLLVATERGLFCPAGGFHIDPWAPVERAVITHGHADHARPGSRRYLAVDDGLPILRRRLGPNANVETMSYGEAIDINGVRISFHPAGHCLGSAQVRVEQAGEVWVVSGDYKVDADPTCRAFEPVACDCFVTESTFALPIFHWPRAEDVFTEFIAWWRENAAAGRTSIVSVYALGKAQRILAGLAENLGGMGGMGEIGPVFVHGAVGNLVEAYREAGVDLPAVERPEKDAVKAAEGRGLVLAPPSALGSPWLRRFGDVSTAFVSGWMTLRGVRRRRNVERGFVLSDHADWEGLHEAIAATGAQRVIVTHGFADVMARHLAEMGLESGVFQTRYGGEEDGEEDVRMAGDSDEHEGEDGDDLPPGGDAKDASP